MTTSAKTALVTGARGGLGLATVRLLAARGWSVFAADLDRSSPHPLEEVAGVTHLHVDVREEASVAAARREVEAAGQGLDAVVNFAGVIALGSMVEMDEPTLMQVLNTNTLGTWRVNRAFFPLVHQRTGRIVNISSENGWQRGAPFNGAYAMSKHAIEAYTDSLRRELALVGVRVVLIQPGPFKTGMVKGLPERFAAVVEASTWFKATLARMHALMAQEYEKANDPQLVADTVLEALTTSSPRHRYSVRPDTQRAFLERLPVGWADALYRRVLRPPDKG